VYSLRFSPDGTKLLSGGLDDGRALLWEVATGRRLGEFRQADGGFVSTAWSAENAMVATAGFDGEVLVWRVADRSKIATLKADSQFVAAVAFSPDGATIAAGGLDRRVTLWEVATGRRLGDPLVHPRWVVALSFDPASGTLATSSQDGRVRLWDLASRRQLGSGLPSPAGQANNFAAFTPDGNHIVVVYATGSGFVWEVDPGQWKARACAVAGRTLTRAEWEELLPGRPYQPACQPAG
jgi:WD40 repeat protein